MGIWISTAPFKLMTPFVNLGSYVSTTATPSTTLSYVEYADNLDKLTNWSFSIPDWINGQQIKITILWNTPATTKVCDWHIFVYSFKEGTLVTNELSDSPELLETSNGTTLIVNKTTWTTSGLNLVPNNQIRLCIQRYGSHAQDTLTDWARIVGLTVEFV